METFRSLARSGKPIGVSPHSFNKLKWSSIRKPHLCIHVDESYGTFAVWPWPCQILVPHGP